MAIWKSNAFSKGDGSGAVALYRSISRFNHACAANCATHWSTKLQQMIFHAVKPISAGEELTFDYIGQAGDAQARAVRLASLEKLGFACRCALCALPSSESVVSDARRSRMASLRAQLKQEQRRGAEGGTLEQCTCLLSELLSLMRQEGVAEVWAHDAILDVIVKAWRTGHRDQCTAWTHRWIADMKMIVGDDLDVQAKIQMLFHTLNDER